MSKRLYPPCQDEIDPNREIEKERDLMIALLRRSVESLRWIILNGEKKNRDKIRIARRSWSWVHAEYKDYPFSFDNVCDTLGYQPIVVREKLYGQLREEGLMGYFSQDGLKLPIDKRTSA